MASYVIITNPTAGRGRSLRMAAMLSGMLRAQGHEASVRTTRGPGDAGLIAAELCEQCQGRELCVVACGGDGTIQAVADALAKCTVENAVSLSPEERRGEGLNTRPNKNLHHQDRGPLLGIAPTGRCNDFARAIGIPRDPRKIVEVLLHGDVTPLDLGRLNGRYFCTVATAGIDAEVSGFVDAMRLPLRGTPAYIYGTLRVLCRFRPPNVRISGDFGTMDGPIFLASSANTSSYGGSIRIAPRASPHDGLLDLCVIAPVRKLAAVGMLLSVLRGRHESSRRVRMFRSARIILEAEPPLELWADGERIGCTPATIESIPDAVRVLTPPRDDRLSTRR